MNSIITQAAYYSVIYPAILPVTPRPFAEKLNIFTLDKFAVRC